MSIFNKANSLFQKVFSHKKNESQSSAESNQAQKPSHQPSKQTTNEVSSNASPSNGSSNSADTARPKHSPAKKKRSQQGRNPQSGQGTRSRNRPARDDKPRHQNRDHNSNRRDEKPVEPIVYDRSNADLVKNGDVNLNVITRDKHNVSRRNMSDNAIKVLNRLNNNGFDAYLVGGGVRDLLLGKLPKDFDIATNATPDQVRDLFRNCRLIGRRFRLAHILFGREVIEVATFRGHHQDANDAEQVEQPKESRSKDQSKQDAVVQSSAQSKEGMLLRDNVYGTIDEDAQRRDFTINAMYYSAADFAIYDYANGVDDLNAGIVRLIGDPQTRYREDPVRMIRAIRFAAKLDMVMAEGTCAPIHELGYLLNDIPAARLYEESLKLLQSGQGLATYNLLREYNVFGALFPEVAQTFTPDRSTQTEQLIEIVLNSTDKRLQTGKRINPAFMFAAFLWYPLQNRAQALMAERNMNYYDAMMQAGNEVISQQVKRLAIPRRHTATIRDIWQLQSRFTRRTGKRAFLLLEQNKFRAGFDLLEMRGEIEQNLEPQEQPSSSMDEQMNEPVSTALANTAPENKESTVIDGTQQLAQWWHEFQHAPEVHRNNMVQALGPAQPTGAKRRRRKPRPKVRKPEGNST